LRDTSLARLSDAWFLLLAGQVTLGAWVIWSNKAADVATAHVAIGAIMLAWGITISAISLRLSRVSEAVPANRSYLVSEKLHAS
jgi:heme A synthase